MQQNKKRCKLVKTEDKNKHFPKSNVENQQQTDCHWWQSPFGTTQGKLYESCWAICCCCRCRHHSWGAYLWKLPSWDKSQFILTQFFFFFSHLLHFTQQYQFYPTICTGIPNPLFSFSIDDVQSLECRSPFFQLFTLVYWSQLPFFFLSNSLPFSLRFELCVLKCVHSPTFQIYMLSWLCWFFSFTCQVCVSEPMQQKRLYKILTLHIHLFLFLFLWAASNWVLGVVNSNPATNTLIPSLSARGNFESPISRTCLVGVNQSTQRKPTQAWGEAANIWS